MVQNSSTHAHAPNYSLSFSPSTHIFTVCGWRLQQGDGSRRMHLKRSVFVNVSRETRRLCCEFMGSCSPLSRRRALRERWNDLCSAPTSHERLSAVRGSLQMRTHNGPNYGLCDLLSRHRGASSRLYIHILLYMRWVAALLIVGICREWRIRERQNVHNRCARAYILWYAGPLSGSGGRPHVCMCVYTLWISMRCRCADIFTDPRCLSVCVGVRMFDASRRLQTRAIDEDKLYTRYRIYFPFIFIKHTFLVYPK